MKSRLTLPVYALLLVLVCCGPHQVNGATSLASSKPDPDVQFVYDAYENLLYKFFDPLALNTPNLFNAALSGVAQKLKSRDIEFIPQKISENAKLDEVYATFPAEMQRAKKLGVGIEGFGEHDLAFAAVEAMLDSVGDSHTYFINPEFNKPLYGAKTYVGVGVVVRKLGKNFYYIDRVMENGPAHKVGIKRLDRLTAIDGRAVGENLREIFSMLRGENGSAVELTIERKQESLRVKIIRGEVANASGSGEIVSESGHTYTYIRLTSFDFNAAPYFNQYAKKGDGKKSEGIILDLRGNPGGLVIAMDAVLNNLLPKGTTMYFLKDVIGFERRKSAGPGKITKPLIVLVDEYSFSASEVTASALKESGRARIVGKKSGGKVGSGMIYKLSFGAAMIVTVSAVYNAKMEPMENSGVEPHVSVSLTKEDIINGEDTQLKAAVKELFLSLEY